MKRRIVEIDRCSDAEAVAAIRAGAGAVVPPDLVEDEREEIEAAIRACDELEIAAAAG